MDRWFRPRAPSRGDYLHGRWKGGRKLSKGCAEYDTACVKENEKSSAPKLAVPVKAGGPPMKTLTKEELFIEGEARQGSPSVIARLMGLNVLSAPESMNKLQSNSCFPRSASANSRLSNLRLVDQSSRVSRCEQQEFRDVFEASESSIHHRKKNPLPCKNLGQRRGCTSEGGSLRRKQLDAAHSSTDEKLQHFRKTCSQHEVFDSMFDQEKISLFPNAFNANSNSASHPPSLITLLKSSKYEKSDDRQTHLKSERKAGRTYLPKNYKQISYADKSSLNSKPVVENWVSLPPLTNTVQSQNEGPPSHPTHIVVLKPSFEKPEFKENIISSTGFSGVSRISYRKPELRTKLAVQAEECQKRAHEYGFRREKIESSSDLWKELEKKSRDNDMDHSSDLSSAEQSDLPQNNSLYRKSEESKVLQIMSTQSDDRERSSNTSHSYSGSSVSREARRHLSKQWIISQRLQKVEHLSESSCTLAQMLALSDQENPYRKYMEARKGSFPLDTSSKNVRKSSYHNTVSESTSVSSSSFCLETQEAINLRKSDVTCPGNWDSIKLEDILGFPNTSFHQPDALSDAKDYHYGYGNHIFIAGMTSHTEVGNSGFKATSVHFLEPRDIISEGKSQTSISLSSHPCFCNSASSDSDAGISDSDDTESVTVLDVDRFLQPSFTLKSSSCSNNVVTEIECNSLMHSQVDSFCNLQSLNSETSAGHRNAEQTSPVSVLDPLGEDGVSNHFQKVSADLHELRLQLRLLKSDPESSTANTEESDTRIEEADCRDSASLPETETCPEFLTEDDERDFSYLLGILTDSGFHGASLDMIFNTCYLPETPVDPCIFEKLERVFDEPEVWSRDERRLLFDLTNSTLSEYLGPYIDLHPWVWSGKIMGHVPKRKVVAEEVWRLLVRRRKEFSSKTAREPFMDSDRIDVRGNLDSIGRYIEKMIRDELLEELILDLTCNS